MTSDSLYSISRQVHGGARDLNHKRRTMTLILILCHFPLPACPFQHARLVSVYGNLVHKGRGRMLICFGFVAGVDDEGRECHKGYRRLYLCHLPR